jgi:hypothetical protein
VTDGVCKSEAVDTPRHIDVGEDDFDVFSGFEQRDGFIGTTSLERIEPCFSKIMTALRRINNSSSTMRTTRGDITAPENQRPR